MDTFIPAVAMAALIFKVMDFLKNLTNKNWNSVVTQLITWVSGVVVVVLYAQTSWADQFGFADEVLSKMNFASLIAVGLGAASFSSVAYDFKKARDNTDSAMQPRLLRDSTSVTYRTVQT